MEIQETLKHFVNQELLNNSKTVNPEDNLLTDGLIDSIGMLRLVAFIEDKYNLKIPYEDLTIENFRSLKVISNYLQKRENGNSSFEN